MRQGSWAGMRRAVVSAVGCGLMLLTGCSEFFTPVNNNPGSGTSSFVYVSNAGSTLAEYSLTSGVLAALSGSPITLPEAPTSIVVSPNNEFLYVGTALGVFMYTIGSDGTLTEGNDDTIIYLNASGLQVTSMVMDATGAWLIMAYQNSTEVDALPIDVTTGLAGTTVFSANLSSSTTSPRLAMSPANTSLFASLGAGGTEVIGFTPAATATPFASSGTKIAVLSATSAATAAASDPSSTFLYITEASTAATPVAGSLRMFALATLGAELKGSPYPTGIGPSAILPDKSGAYVYVANSTDSTLSGYTVNTTSQTVTALGSTIPTANTPIGLAEDSSKTYILAAGNGSNPNLFLYSFDASSAGVLDINTTTSTSTTNPAVANAIAVTH